MQLAILMRAAAIAGPALFACAGPAPAQVCANGNLSPVPFVTTPFAPATNTTPQPDQTRPVNNDVQTDLAAAFAAAGTDFQNKLCGLDAMFVDPSGCADPGPTHTYDPTTCNFNGALITGYSWGLRTYSPNPYPGKRYIAVSLGLWNNKNASLPKKYRWSCFLPQKVCAPPFSSFVAAFLDAVVNVPSPNSGHGAYSVSVTPPTVAASPAMSVLAALAHEFGHVYWFDSFVTNPGGSFANNFCGGTFYPGQSWENTSISFPPPLPNSSRFIFFGDASPYPGSQVAGLPSTLHSIYSSGKWASALAAFSPVEDFVETFELAVLKRAGLTGLQINSDPIVPAPGGSWLEWKLGCFS